MANRLLGALAALLLCASAQAQTITFSAQATTGNGSLVPSFTWSTTPPATDCDASGAANWTGKKAASGTQTLPAITKGATYNLTCTWPVAGFAQISWANPTTNTDGSPYADPASSVIRYGLSETALTRMETVTDPTATTRRIEPLGPGTWYFGVVAVNKLGLESAMSMIGNKTIPATQTQTRSVGITVNPVPSAPSGVRVQ